VNEESTEIEDNLNCNNIKTLEEDKFKKILEIHQINSHRKDISEIVKSSGIEISKNNIAEILKHCDVCARKDDKYGKSARLKLVRKPGEIVGKICLKLVKKKE
jgi:hypothetical protein